MTLLGPETPKKYTKGYVLGKSLIYAGVGLVFGFIVGWFFGLEIIFSFGGCIAFFWTFYSSLSKMIPLTREEEIITDLRRMRNRPETPKILALLEDMSKIKDPSSESIEILNEYKNHWNADVRVTTESILIEIDKKASVGLFGPKQHKNQRSSLRIKYGKSS